MRLLHADNCFFHCATAAYAAISYGEDREGMDQTWEEAGIALRHLTAVAMDEMPMDEEMGVLLKQILVDVRENLGPGICVNHETAIVTGEILGVNLVVAYPHESSGSTELLAHKYGEHICYDYGVLNSHVLHEGNLLSK